MCPSKSYIKSNVCHTAWPNIAQSKLAHAELTYAKEIQCLCLYLVCRSLSFHLYHNAKHVHTGSPEHFSNDVCNQRAFDLSKKKPHPAEVCLLVCFGGFWIQCEVHRWIKGWVLRPSTNSEFPVTPNDLRRFFWSKNFLKLTETCILVDLWKQTVLYVKCVSKSHITKTPPVVLCVSFIHSPASSAVIMMRNSKAVLWGGFFWPRRGCCSNCSRAVSETFKLLGWC